MKKWRDRAPEDVDAMKGKITKMELLRKRICEKRPSKHTHINEHVNSFQLFYTTTGEIKWKNPHRACNESLAKFDSLLTV